VDSGQSAFRRPVAVVAMNLQDHAAAMRDMSDRFFDLCLGSVRVPPIRVTNRTGARAKRRAQAGSPSFGATDIARKPNYDFERRERDRIKLAESAKKAQAKSDKRAAEQALAVSVPSDGSDER